jgi:hypothetical protein
MAVIKINIEVLNAKELVKREKGKFTGFIAGLVMSDELLRKNVEEKVCLEIVKKLKETLEPGLQSEGIKANTSFSVVLREEHKNL